MKKRILFLILGMSLLRVNVASAIFATEGTQIMNNIQLFQQTLQKVKSLQHQAMMIQNQLKNLASYRDGNWTDSYLLIYRVDQILKQAKGLVYQMSRLGEDFTTRYKGYSAPEDFMKDYKSASDSIWEALDYAKKMANLQENLIQDEGVRLDLIQQRSDSALGQLQAIQANSMFAKEMIVQIQQLRILLAAQMNAQTEVTGGERFLEESSRAAGEESLRVEDENVEFIDYSKELYGWK